jgi:hypothetical protein
MSIVQSFIVTNLVPFFGIKDGLQFRLVSKKINKMFNKDVEHICNEWHIDLISINIKKFYYDAQLVVFYRKRSVEEFSDNRTEIFGIFGLLMTVAIIYKDNCFLHLLGKIGAYLQYSSEKNISLGTIGLETAIIYDSLQAMKIIFQYTGPESWSEKCSIMLIISGSFEIVSWAQRMHLLEVFLL